MSEMFVDEAAILARSGKGGTGCVSFRREAHVPRGGPDGGDGGRGGDVILEATHSVTTLVDFSRKRIWAARNGQPGRGSAMRGKSAGDLVIPVPLGTIVHDASSDEFLADLTGEGERAVLVRGGKGGRGNRAFASATRRTPRHAESGGAGEERRIRLELRFMADVGLLGLPNAGKSTFLRGVSAALPNVASYPFTTRSPVLGVLQSEDYRRIVVADIPGLIEGAHEGVGLGHRFLRHLERTRILMHTVDVAPEAGLGPVEAYRVVRKEVSEYDPTILEKPEVIVATKMDLPGAADGLSILRQAVSGEIFPISSNSGHGVAALVGRLFELCGGGSST